MDGFFRVLLMYYFVYLKKFFLLNYIKSFSTKEFQKRIDLVH